MCVCECGATWANENGVKEKGQKLCWCAKLVEASRLNHVNGAKVAFTRYDYITQINKGSNLEIPVLNLQLFINKYLRTSPSIIIKPLFVY